MIVNELKTKVVIYGTQDSNFSFKFDQKNLYCGRIHIFQVLNSCNNMKGNPFKNMTSYSSGKSLKASFATVRKYCSFGF